MPYNLKLEYLSQPTCRLPFINNPTVYMPEQRCLAAVNFSNEGRDSRLFLIDADTLESVTVALPDAQFGAYGMALGTDGRLYIGFFGGRIYAFDARDRTFTRVADPYDDPRHLTWGGAASRAGRIYMGVYPNAAFTEYDISSGSHHVVKPLPEGTRGAYARDFVELPDGRMLILLKGSHPGVIIYDPQSGKMDAHVPIHCGTVEVYAPGTLCLLNDDHVIYGGHDALHTFNFKTLTWGADYLSALAEPLGWMCPQNGGFLACGQLEGRLYHVDRSGCRELATGVDSGNRVSGGVHAVDDDTWVGLGDNGLAARFSLTRGPLATRQLDNETATGLSLHALCKDSATHHIVGSHFINSQIFHIDARTAAVTASSNKITETGGQVTCITFLHGMAYLGFYGGASILRFDPEAPIQFGRNPKCIARAGMEQNRPMGIYHHGGKLYMATRAGYEKLGGAICVLDPETADMEVHRHFVPEQNPVSFFHRGDGCFVGTTDIHGDQGSCLPKADGAVAFVWDAKSASTIATCQPWQADALAATDLSATGLLVGFGEKTYYIYDTIKGTCTTMPWDQPPPGFGKFIDGVHLLLSFPYEAAGKCRMLILNVLDGTVIELGDFPAIRLFQQTEPGKFLASVDGYKVATVRLEPDADALRLPRPETC